jgi:AcrR family transcriptional regulator
MDKKSQRLGRQDWILAGFRALAAGGLSALRVEPVARAIGASKGSFYWHFIGPADWRDAMLDFWQKAALSDVLVAVEHEPDARARLYQLIRIVSTMGRAADHGGVMAEPALRAWAQSDATVARAIADVDAARVQFLAQSLQEAKLPALDANVAARLIYAAHIGQQALGHAADQDIADLDDLLELLFERRAG